VRPKALSLSPVSTAIIRFITGGTTNRAPSLESRQPKSVEKSLFIPPSGDPSALQLADRKTQGGEPPFFELTCSGKVLT